MRIFGLEINRAQQKAALSVPDPGRGWVNLVREPFTGAWQRGITVDRQSVLSNHAAFASITLIASDVAKLRCKLVEKSKRVWQETDSASFSPVLRKPNRYQNHIQFWENWMISKLTRGNTYVLKERDNRGVVVALYVLDANRVRVLVADDGSVFYRLNADNLTGVGTEITVPASEIIHDRFNCLFHPLVGLSPIFAAGASAAQGNAIQNSSTWFFANKSQPGGLLTAPGAISKENADRLKETFESGFTGENAGRIAVVSDGMKYEALAVTAHDAQLIEQLKWSAETVCSTFHVPPYKIGVGQMPPYTNVQALNVEYYSQCLQRHIEDAEACLDEGLGLGFGSNKALGTQFDIANLLRMDSVAQMEMLDKGKNIMTPNEAREPLNLPPVMGGDTVYRQQQEFSLEALSKRDAKEDPFATDKPKPQPAAANDQPPSDEAKLAKAMTPSEDNELSEIEVDDLLEEGWQSYAVH